MKSITFTLFTFQCIERFEKNGRFSTAHLYKCALHSFSLFLKKASVSFLDLTRDCLKAYEQWLEDQGKLPNTISTYLRMLRSIYNKGIDHGLAPYKRRLFHNVYTGVDIRHKKSLNRNDIHTLLYKDPGSETLRKTQLAARLSYQLCGMPFVDLTHIQKSDIEGDTLEYRRMKTGTTVRVRLLPQTIETIHYLKKKLAEKGKTGEKSPTLFHLFHCDHSFRSLKGYIEYQKALCKFNAQLKRLSKRLKIRKHITSYTLRHSWATAAKYTGAPIEMISELLGHKSIKTTQIYLAAFDDNELAKVNQRVYKYAECER
ncbi:site-specific integrase [Prevotella cerevisiae]|uniref:Site-specific integrase n=1 Tax=Segatella cerevisiae TaxID=2053716 RepID=A0ABT1BZA1_9BACT|nr:site-specific integrase [Segatella cerevisiae]MCO6026030.1 site-specific integrase [Segatella cerevisiae]